MIMNDGQQPTLPPSGNPGQVPPTQIPVTSLAPPPGNGGKMLVIIGILTGLIGGGIWLLSSMKGEEDANAEVEKKVDTPKTKPRAKPRKAEKTTKRPMKKEMAELSSKNRSDFKKNVGKWVRLQGEIETGDVDGVLIFKEPAKMKGQLVKGSAEHLTGQVVKVIGWMISVEEIQINGIFEITTVDPIDLLPKKEVYTIEDAKQLVALRNTTATFKGKVKSVRVSGDKKNLYLIFEGESHEFFGSGTIDKLKKDEVTEETLKDLIGKTIKLKGKLAFKKQDEKDRIFINFDDKEDYEVVE
jgi:hypothetical protein